MAKSIKGNKMIDVEANELFDAIDKKVSNKNIHSWGINLDASTINRMNVIASRFKLIVAIYGNARDAQSESARKTNAKKRNI